MKKSILIISISILIVLVSCHKVEYNGQTGKILHKKYDPALNINYIGHDEEVEQDWDTIRLDLDQDQITDLKIYFYYDNPKMTASKDWEISRADIEQPINEVDFWGQDYNCLTSIYVRRTVDAGYCYGWIAIYCRWGSEGQISAIRLYVSETAYCTCPNYPLKWGEK